MATDTAAALRIAELEADNSRLRRLLDQRDAPGELRHRLRNTMAILRGMIRKSAETGRDLDNYVGHLEDRLETLARAEAFINETGVVELHTLFADELLHYAVMEGDQATVLGPDVEFKPQAGQVLALAIHELVVNAVEHGALGAGTGQVEVASNVADEGSGPVLTLIWKEFDSDLHGNPSRSGFGTDVLTQMLRYELKAETSLAFEPDGLRCTIRLPLPENVGRVIHETVQPDGD
jgi:two-component sensor histidine kinase